jgi:hypothetical protein
MGLVKGGVLALAVLAAPAAWAQQSLQLSDCSPAALDVLYQRIYEAEGKLRPLVMSRDVLHVTMCDDPGPRFQLRTLAQALKNDSLIEGREILKKAAPDPILDGALDDACGGKRPCTAQVYRRKDYDPGTQVPYAKSGGLPLARFLGHMGVEGHFEITGRAAAQVGGWSTDALDILQAASQDADLYEWGNPAAHAQTVNDAASGRIARDKEAAASATFERWSSTYFAKAAQLCAQQRPREALYLIGYGLHGVQDLAFHEGITNAEHSYRDFRLDEQIDADDHGQYQEKLGAAVLGTRLVLSGLKQKLQVAVPGCWASLTGYTGKTALSGAEREALLIRPGQPSGKDFGIAAYLEYQRLSGIVYRQLMAPGASEADFYIAQRWLRGRNPVLLRAYVDRILAGVQL